MNPRLVGVAAAAVLVAGVAGVLVVRDRDGDGAQLVAGDGGTTTTSEDTTTTTSTSSTTTTAVVATTAAPTTSTTARATTTTTAPTRGTFSISPTSGPGHQRVTGRGTGCKGTDAGAGLTIYTPSGKAITGTGGSAMPDGTWEIPFSVPPDEGPGRYKVVASCTIPAGGGFVYAPQYYTVTS